MASDSVVWATLPTQRRHDCRQKCSCVDGKPRTSADNCCNGGKPVLYAADAIRQFEDAAADSDIAVVYPAGHGSEIHGVKYLIPIDAKLASDRDAEDEAIALVGCSHPSKGPAAKPESTPRSAAERGSCTKAAKNGNPYNLVGKRIVATPIENGKTQDEKHSPTHAADARTVAAPYDPYDRSRRVTPGGPIRGMPGGHGLGGKIICGRGRGGYNPDGSPRGYWPGP
jgi:hypothetical protein